MRRKKETQPEDEARSPNRVDAHVGARIRLRRTLLGLSQMTLGERVGLTFQQIQKYERGANRVSASRLWQFGAVLDVPVSFFFDDLSEQPGAAPDSAEAAVEAAAVQPDPMTKRETLELVRAYYRVTDPNMRRRLFELVKAVAASSAAVGPAAADAA